MCNLHKQMYCFSSNEIFSGCQIQADDTHDNYGINSDDIMLMLNIITRVMTTAIAWYCLC